MCCKLQCLLRFASFFGRVFPFWSFSLTLLFCFVNIEYLCMVLSAFRFFSFSLLLQDCTSLSFFADPWSDPILSFNMCPEVIVVFLASHHPCHLHSKPKSDLQLERKWPRFTCLAQCVLLVKTQPKRACLFLWKFRYSELSMLQRAQTRSILPVQKYAMPRTVSWPFSRALHRLASLLAGGRFSVPENGFIWPDFKDAPTWWFALCSLHFALQSYENCDVF